MSDHQMILKCAVSEYSSISASINHIPLCYMTQHVAFIAFTQPVSLQKKKKPTIAKWLEKWKMHPMRARYRG